MEQPKNIPVRIDVTPENLEVLNNDVKRLNEGLEKACQNGTYGLKESQLLCTSIENFASIVMQITQSAQVTLEKIRSIEEGVEKQKREMEAINEGDGKKVTFPNTQN